MEHKITNRRNSQTFIRHTKIIGFIVASLVFVGAFTGIVKAAIAIINTNDGAQDSNWGTPLIVDGDDAGVADDLDIDTFWVNTDAASPTTYYFGVSTVSPLRTAGGVRICIKMDCNGDGDVTDAADRVLEINPSDTIYDVAGNSSSTYEANAATDGEFVGRYIEARTNNSGSISWAGCMAGNPVIQAEVRDGFCPDLGTLYDATELRAYTPSATYYALTISRVGNGSLTPDVGTHSYIANTSMTLDADPATGWEFDGWSGDLNSTANPAQVTMNSDKAITATFTLKTYVITPTAGTGGSVDPDAAQTVTYGSDQTFTIAPDTGYHIVDVHADDVSQGAVTSHTFNNVAANHTISATFALNTYIITPTAGTGGSINPAAAQTITYGSDQTFTITPDTGYHIVDVRVDDVSQDAVTSHTFSDVAADHTISATFALDTFVITPTAGTGGSISPATAQTVTYSSEQTFTITPDTGCHIVDVRVDDVSQGAVTSHTFSDITTDHTISATFALNTYVITPTAGTGGSISPAAAQTVTYGSDQIFTIAPDTGCHIVDVCVDDVSQGAVTSHTFSNVTADHTISATFAPDRYMIYLPVVTRNNQ